MGLFDNIAKSRGYSKAEPQQKGELSTGDSWSEIFGGGSSNSFTTFNSQKEQLQAYVDWVYGAVHFIAETCSTIDLRLFANNTKLKNASLAHKLVSGYDSADIRKQLDKYKKTSQPVVVKENGKLTTKAVPLLEEVETHPLLDLLDSPNPYMTRFEFFEMTFLHLELAGEAFWAINRKNGKGAPIELWPLMPNAVQVVADKNNFIAGYVYTVNGEKLPFSPDDIIHHKYSNPNDLRRGMSTVQAAARIIDTDTHMADYNRRIFYNGATVDAVLYTDNKLTDQNWKRLKSEWKDQYSGSANAHRTAILENGLKYQPMSLSNRDLDFLAGMNFNKDMILGLYGVSKSLLGMDESMSRANAETAEYVFAKHKQRSKMLRLTARITQDLAPQFDERLVVSFTDPVPDDKAFLLEEKKAALGGGTSIGWRTPNEVRAEDGDDPVEGGDEIFISGTLKPMAYAAQEPIVEETPAVAEEDPSKPDPEDDGEGNPDDDSGDAGTTSTDTGDDTSTDTSSDTSKSQKSKKKITHELESPVAKANTRPHRSQDAIDKDALNFEALRDAIVDKAEEKFLKVSRSRFEQQKKEVIDNFTKYYNGQKSIKPRSKGLKDKLKELFDKHKSEAAWLALLIPIYKSSINTMGQAALDNVLGDSGEKFSTADASIAKYYEERASLISIGIDETTQKELAASLTEGINKGEALSELVDRIEYEYGAAAGYRAVRIARTESIAATTRATIDAWNQSGVVYGKRWSIGSQNPCKHCLDLDGKIIKLNENFFNKGDEFTVEGAGTMKLTYDDTVGPPLHVNCACTLIAVLSE